MGIYGRKEGVDSNITGLPQNTLLWRAEQAVGVGGNVCCYFALLIQKIQDPHLGFNQVDARLVIREVNQRPGDLLLQVFLLLQLEDVLGGTSGDSQPHAIIQRSITDVHTR